jgi:hypothetical protein
MILQSPKAVYFFGTWFTGYRLASTTFNKSFFPIFFTKRNKLFAPEQNLKPQEALIA